MKLSVKVKLKFAESNLLDNRGIEAVKTAVKPHTLKEKKRESGIRGSKSRLLGEVAPTKNRCGGGREWEERPEGHRPAL